MMYHDCINYTRVGITKIEQALENFTKLHMTRYKTAIRRTYVIKMKTRIEPIQREN